MRLDRAPTLARIPHVSTMNIILLKTLHLAGVFALFASLGATMLGGSGKKGAAILHGISLVVILLVGFAMLKKPPMGEYWWMAKLGLWLFIGAAPALAKRKVLPAPVVLALTVAAAGLAGWLGLMKSAAF
jgi:hypothetical protein